MGTNDYGAAGQPLSAPSLSDWAGAVAQQLTTLQSEITTGLVIDGSGVDITSDKKTPTFVVNRWWLHPATGTPDAVSKAHGSTTSAGTPTGTCAVVLPAGIATGQIGVAFLLYANNGASAPAASGWALLGSSVQGANMTTAVLTKTLAAADSGTTVTFQFTTGSSTRMAVIVVVCDAVTTSSAVQAQANETTGTSGNHTIPTATAAGPGLTLGLAAERPATTTSATWTVPAPYEEKDDSFVSSGTSLDWVVAVNRDTTAGSHSIGNVVFTSSGGTQANAQMRTVHLPAA